MTSSPDTGAAQTNAELLRILILEDVPSDADLMEYELREAGLVFASRRVEAREAFILALDDFHPHIVLADYKLPAFDGLSALRIVRGAHPEIPLIIVTGVLPDADAAELFKEGVTDYILKDRLSRLAPAVKKALSAELGIRARKAAEKSLRASESLFHALARVSPVGIFHFDAQGLCLYVNERWSEIAGRSPEQARGSGWNQAVHPEDREWVAEKWRHAVMNKLPFQEEYRYQRPDGTITWVLEQAIAEKNAAGETVGFVGTITNITEHKETEKERLANAEKLKQTLLQAIEAIAATVEAHDPYTAGHQRRVAFLASTIAHEMGFSADRIQGLYLAATIHDLGKIHLPAEILSRPGRLMPVEFELIKVHPQAGYNIIKDVEFPWPIAQMVFQHHEKMDGSGYPQGLKGEQILPEARIISVADVVEAMSSFRPYRPGLGIDAALEEISRQRGVLYDPLAVDNCLALFRDKGFAFG